MSVSIGKNYYPIVCQCLLFKNHYPLVCQCWLVRIIALCMSVFVGKNHFPLVYHCLFFILWMEKWSNHKQAFDLLFNKQLMW